MNKSGYTGSTIVLLSFLFISICFSDCKKPENPIKYKKGTFPDSVINIADINSPYDDYNSTLLELSENLQIVFSSNRKSTGGQFDLEQGIVVASFIQTNGDFFLRSGITSDPFLSSLINKAQTSGDDFGPYRLFSTADGYEYLLLSSENAAGNLDLYYLKNQPAYGSGIPEITGPLPIKLMNTSSDDAYLCLNADQDTAYFSSNKDGNFDIFFLKIPKDKELSSWFGLDYALPLKEDSINSPYEDKCPYISKKVMVFASNRPGGSGGYDLYYSIYRNGRWCSPVNLGPRINTSSDEYRPVIGFNQDFTNKFLIFSSNRPGGKGGFDLYFTGIDFPVK